MYNVIILFQESYGKVSVKKGEICSWFFDGELGPEYIINVK